MSTARILYLEGCPYCEGARRALGELVQENPEYGKLEIEWVEEEENPEISEQYDYYYVPTVFYGDRKLYEADPSQEYEDIKAKVKEALDYIAEEERL